MGTDTTPASGAGSLTPCAADVAWAKGTVVLPTQSDADADAAGSVNANPRGQHLLIPLSTTKRSSSSTTSRRHSPICRLVPSDIDSASLQLSVQAVTGTCAAAQSGCGKQPAVDRSPLGADRFDGRNDCT